MKIIRAFPITIIHEDDDDGETSTTVVASDELGVDEMDLDDGGEVTVFSEELQVEDEDDSEHSSVSSEELQVEDEDDSEHSSVSSEEFEAYGVDIDDDGEERNVSSETAGEGINKGADRRTPYLGGRCLNPDCIFYFHSFTTMRFRLNEPPLHCGHPGFIQYIHPTLANRQTRKSYFQKIICIGTGRS